MKTVSCQLILIFCNRHWHVRNYSTGTTVKDDRGDMVLLIGFAGLLHARGVTAPEYVTLWLTAR